LQLTKYRPYFDYSLSLRVICIAAGRRARR
jgi:hypothetical protein